MWYELEIDADDNDTYIVTAPDFPEVTTYGVDVEECLLNGLNAIEEAVAARISRNEDLPKPFDDKDESEHRRQYAVRLRLLSFLKMGLYTCCRDDGISRAELVRRLGWHREQVDRLFRLDHKSQLEQIEQAFKAIDIELRSPLPTFQAHAA